MKTFEDVDIFSWDKEDKIQFVDISYMRDGDYIHMATYNGDKFKSLIKKDKKGNCYFVFKNKVYIPDDFHLTNR